MHHPHGAVQERAYEFIKGRILTSHLKPGQRLNALELASKLKTSRTPIREALSRLEQEGLVRREGGGGYRVRAVSLKEVLDLYKVREPLEVEAALEALPHLDANTIADLSEILSEAHQLLDRGSIRSFLLVNRKFHMTIAKTTGNAVLYQMLSGISDRIQLICEIVIHRHSPRSKEILEENFRILDALKQKDPGAVETAMRAHIQRSGERAFNFLGQELGRLYVGADEHA